MKTAQPLLYVEIAVNVPRVMGVFHYHLPDELAGRVAAGHLVEVPFGRQRVQGVVLRSIESPEVPETRQVFSLLDDEPALNSDQLALAAWLAEDTLAPLAACVSLMLPPGLSVQADTRYSLLGEPPDNLTGLKERLVGLLAQRGPLRGRQIDALLPRTKWQRTAQDLVRRGVLASQPVLPPPSVAPKRVRTVQLAVSPEEAATVMDDLGSTQATRSRRSAMLQYLLGEREPVEVSWVYAAGGEGSKRQDLILLAERGLVVLGESEVWRDPLENLAYDPAVIPPLTADQQCVWAIVLEALRRGVAAPFLLHGVTGSGKTEIYLRAVAEVISQGRQAIVLVPEIALTPQTVRRFQARFPGRVGLIHSRLSQGERYDTWRRAGAGMLDVVVGPRSALFSPLPNPGLIVVDESHDSSYYQNEQIPYYHARHAAVAYAGISGAVCLLGSATPDVGSRYRAERGKWQLLELPARILAHRATIQNYKRSLGQVTRYQPAGEQAEMADLPPVEVVDMRAELKGGNRSIFSRALQQALQEVLKNQQQAILFLNRRGSATYVFCRDCGHSLECPRCDMPLTYHGANRQLTCHHCGYARNFPKTCPQCKGSRIRQLGTGTERVEAEVQALLPHARTLRWDWETTRKKGAHDMILSQFAGHRADILIGTQMLAKGLDLPLVTLVGVVLADVGLHLPDYRAGERVFQVLTQVSGRAGRSPLGGQVVLQTFNPEHYVIQAAAGHDYAAFYRQELDHRRRLRYPPFARLVRLELRHHDAGRAEEEARRMAAQIRHRITSGDRRATEIIGPAPCFFARVSGQYRWQIILRGPDPASLLHNQKLGDWRVESNPQALL